MSTRKQILYSVILLVLAGGAVGFYGAWASPAEETGGMEGHNHAAMGGGEGDQPSPVSLTDRAARTIGVTFATVERRPLDREVRTVGTVEYDETRLANLNPKIEGWVERLYVDFTGAPVRKGQAMLEVYSPKLVTAQEELILARRLADDAEGDRARRNAESLLESARRRLAYWDIPTDQIARIEETGRPTKTLTLRSPASGIVVAKNVVEGGRIMPGMDVYEIADLSTIWVEGEVFEKDLALAGEGQAAQVTFQAYPGEVFEGVITYVYPTVSMDSRTGKVRVELQNPGLRLRPGMYANIRLKVPGHHEGLTVPRTAVLFTGERAVVFVRHDDGVLTPHEVSTGLVAGDDIEILAGLQEGQKVVTSASFLIDAESNLGASMDAMEGSEPGEDADHSGHAVESATKETPDPTTGAVHQGQSVVPADDHSGHE
jgi:Cu(I)/Ag(I) efflux system membrane fusion protein